MAKKKYGRFSSKTSGNKKIKNAKKHTYDGVEFRSGLEVYMYKQLKANNIPFRYEQDKYVIMEKFTCENTCWATNKDGIFTESKPNIRNIEYNPDFVGINQEFIVETKGFETPEFKIKYKLFKQYLKDNNIKCTLYMPHNQKECNKVIELILESRKNENTI